MALTALMIAVPRIFPLLTLLFVGYSTLILGLTA
jgi:hypothetical protein